MRIHVDLQSHLTGDPQIIQVEKTPEDFGLESQIPVNGQYLIPVPEDLSFHIDENSYVLNGGNIDGGDVTSIGFAHLLARFPQYGNIYFNPLLTEDHVSELDFNGIFVENSIDFPARFQSGREGGAPLDSGQMPTHTAILPLNPTTTPPRPGVLISQEIDIGPFTLDCNGNPVGTENFMLYWKLYGFQVSHDISATNGAQAGKNEPALRYVQEVDQEPADFSAYISINAGATWTQGGLLEPLTLSEKSTTIHLAFRNDSSSKIYIAHFGVLF